MGGPQHTPNIISTLGTRCNTEPLNFGDPHHDLYVSMVQSREACVKRASMIFNDVRRKVRLQLE